MGFLQILSLELEQSQNMKGRKFVSAATKMVPFLTAGSWEIVSILGAADF
jgi:hypothetical protein